MSTLPTFALKPEAESPQAADAATLFFHYPCFDGLISAVIAWDYLQTHQAWQVVFFSPVDYGIRGEWLSTHLHAPCAVVDFLYHPRATFWADHHLTTFLNDEARSDFDSRSKDCLLYDPSVASCASLLWSRFGSLLADDRYPEMVLWAEKIDSAAYISVDEAIFGQAPALQINSSLILGNDIEYCRVLLTALRSKTLREVAAISEVQSRHREAKTRLVAGLRRLKSCIRLEPGGIVIFDADLNGDREIVSRYAPFHFYPDARYSIGMVRSHAGTRITAMRNPWRNFRSIPLGEIFEHFGGGGHERVGAVLLPPDKNAMIPGILDSLRRRMQEPPRTGA
jgi:hypothetical protein